VVLRILKNIKSGGKDYPIDYGKENSCLKFETTNQMIIGTTMIINVN
jgi:hypothetical protein